MPRYQLPPDLNTNPQATILSAEFWHINSAIDELHAMGIDGRGVTIAVNDTAGRTDHKDLPDAETEDDFTDDPTFADGHGHGHHCSGIALGRGGMGVAPGASLQLNKVLNRQGSGAGSWINAGRKNAADNGADICSESLGGSGWYPEDIKAYEYAYENGLKIGVAAAGNSGYKGRNTIGTPGKYLESWCIGSHDIRNNISTFSSGGREIDSAAPGDQIKSTLPGNKYATWSGTSMATPFAAGLFALIIQKRRQLGLPEIVGAVAWREWFADKGFFMDAGEPGFDPKFGRGILSIEKVITWLLLKEPKNL